MKIGVLGTGVVGETIATKLVALGHDTMMGSRMRANEKATAWVRKAGGSAKEGTFADAAQHGEVLFNCTRGDASIAALEMAGAENLKGKILVDVANPLDFSKGMPPTLFLFNTDSLGEKIQRTFPDTKVVKTLNTVNCHVMVDAGRLPSKHTMFMSGNDKAAKGRVHEILSGWFGWQDVVDLGDITTARGSESYLLLWVRMWGALGSADFNVHVVRK